MTYGDQTREEVLRALRAAPHSVAAIAAAYGIHHGTVTRWARAAGVKLPTPRERMKLGQAEGASRRWGDWEARRKYARKMRQRGAELAEIREALGYSLGGASYAARSKS